MRIEISGRNVSVTDDLREQITKRFAKVDRLVSELAICEVLISEEHNPKIAESQAVEARLQVKGALLHATASARELRTAVGHVADELQRQAERHREKVRNVRKVGTESIRRGALGSPLPEVAEAD